MERELEERQTKHVRGVERQSTLGSAHTASANIRPERRVRKVLMLELWRLIGAKLWV